MDTSLLHPMLVHFPIALLIVGFLSDLAGLIAKRPFFTRSGMYLSLLGALGVIAAYVSGTIAGDGLSEAGALKQALERHEGAAELTLWITLLAAVTRAVVVLMKERGARLLWIALVLAAAAVGSVARTGYYGGELVFKHAAGVRLSLGIGEPETEVTPPPASTDNASTARD